MLTGSKITRGPPLPLLFQDLLIWGQHYNPFRSRVCQVSDPTQNTEVFYHFKIYLKKMVIGVGGLGRLCRSGVGVMTCPALRNATNCQNTSKYSSMFERGRIIKA